jgi:hypothetical protein
VEPQGEIERHIVDYHSWGEASSLEDPGVPSLPNVPEQSGDDGGMNSCGGSTCELETVHGSLKLLRCGTTGQSAAFQTMAARGQLRRR